MMRLAKQTIVAIFGLWAIAFGVMTSFVLISVAVIFVATGIFLLIAIPYIK